MEHPQRLFDLTGKVAVVTGSTRGLGRVIAEGYSRAGAAVVVSGRKPESCAQAAAAIRDLTAGEVTALACHVGDWDAIPQFVQQVLDTHGSIDVLVNNAGINPGIQTLTDVTAELWRKIFAVNVEGPLRMSQCVAPVMRDTGGGSIINIGSMEGYQGNQLAVAYGASKAALRHLTATMANAWASWHIRVNLLSPGPFATEMLTSAEQKYPGTLDMLAGTNAQKRVAEVSEILGPALYLASDASSFVTGDDLTVNGGMHK